MKLIETFKIQFEKSNNIYTLIGDDIAYLNVDDTLIVGRALRGKLTSEDKEELLEHLLNLKKHGDNRYIYLRKTCQETKRLTLRNEL